MDFSSLPSLRLHTRCGGLREKRPMLEGVERWGAWSSSCSFSSPMPPGLGHGVEAANRLGPIGQVSRQIVPFGKNIPRKPGAVYFVASGEQECDNATDRRRGRSYGRSFPNLCSNELQQAEPMCKPQQRVLQGCPIHE